MVSIPNLGAHAVSGSKITWSGNIDSLRYDPVPVIANIKIDWIRLVERETALYRTIQWAGNSGNVDIYLDNDKNEGNGTLGKVAANVSGTSYSLFVGALSPGFNYYVGIKPSSGGAMSYSAGYYWVNDIPTLVFTSPSQEGGDDFATVELGNAWNMNSTSDLDGYANLSSAPTATTINAVDRAGNNLNNLTVLKGTNKSGFSDPILYLLWFNGGRGASTKIDSSKYRILVLKMGLPGNWDLVGGSVARVYWHVQGEFFNSGIEKMHQSADIIVRHKSGNRTTIDNIIADMKELTLESSQSTTGWNGNIDGFRLDPHEFSTSKTFYIDEVKLAAFERADESYTIKWEYTNTHSTSAENLSLYYDTNDRGYNGTRIKSGINPASGQYTWDTSNMADGTYYIYAVYSDGTNSNRTYARWPIVIDHTPSPPPTPPTIKLNKSSLTFSASGSNSQSFTVSNSGGGTLNWTVSDNRAWMSVNPTSGQNSGTVTVKVNRTGLSAGTYKGTVTVTDSNASNSPQTVSVTLQVSGGSSGGTPKIGINRSYLNFGAAGSKITSPQILLINNTGAGTLNWSISDNKPWLSVSPTSGTNSGVVNITTNKSGLSTGTYYGTITISDPNASNSPRKLPVWLRVYNSGSTAKPFGDFATPTHGSTVRSSIPVTGWVLDDIEVKNVKIYNGSNYVGDAVFVDGARPDVESAYPDYPRNYQAGWGYMMLTNFLPGGGNGKYIIRAKATDAEGHTVTLGSKTIIVDNANAVKPFGAIDTPTQGGTASGANFINWGWALTPQPNKIPTNGSTIDVVINGVKIGHPTYNNYRADIAGLFPSYNNSNGAIGYFYLDTTAYENGVHTIQWIAKDNAGNSDGIGSRYFTIQNTGGSRAFPAEHQIEGAASGTMRRVFNVDASYPYPVLSRLPVDNQHPIRVKKGFKDNEKPQMLKPDEGGNIMVEIKELERLEIHLTPETTPAGWYSGFLSSEESLKPLPIGSTLDAARGVFYWSPGPGFVGDYELVFIDLLRNRLRRVNIRILPKYSLD
ncbi:MAG: hypothetical protein GTO45_32125 [Candidatus Aminicenantes bacterium]|nr:hypothetical protein [Candidatus Aminicenantes bacterium]NIM83397.1 hypothetical protein [Candidatus Aminicenantes bacterium]NIN22789.1 hypothetical protein [Candidatus Aminicenantes bacterium]NIN46523.1 hypothetical protein [Candidatus Aminicenantes bacterium]NIN89428.1 hypothetical protein [Candidatus Aminicenantes bacterium]